MMKMRRGCKFGLNVTLMGPIQLICHSYVVEKITGHEFMKNVCLSITWGYIACTDPFLGCSPPSGEVEGLREAGGYDLGARGWTIVSRRIQIPLCNLKNDPILTNLSRDGAKEVVTAYYRAIGGRPLKPTPEPAKKGPGRKRKSIGEPKLTPAPTPPTETKRRRKSAAAKENSVKETNAKENNAETPALTEDNSDGEGNWVPNFKNWDEELGTVDTIIRDTEGPGLSALLLWKNGKKSRVTLETCYEKCPKKVSQ